MDRQQVESTVLKIIGTVLKEPVSSDASRAGFARWDSLKHIEIMFALEDEFGVVFSEEELSDLDSVAVIVERVVSDAA
ncbi:acyl carrier protein [Castellaniella defragrans]|uniref:acyl carrier protein n=1 Tax=Castellaniella defragrans TaxID=75697 RepID=UPI002AFFD97E|nr:acyl carrier protein [Castellaniella defragrans]